MSDDDAADAMKAAAAAAQVVTVDTDAWAIMYLAELRKASPTNLDLRLRLTDAVAGKTIAIAVQTRAELLTWPVAKGWGDRKAAALRAAVDATLTVPLSSDVLEAWVNLSAQCRQQNHALGYKEHAMDRWVAATAIALGTPLLALDRGYVGAPGLTLLAF